MLALFTFGAVTVAPQAHADGACSNLAGDASAFNACVKAHQVDCKGAGGAYFWGHVICTYPDGGVDDCVVPFTQSGATCTYRPPGQ